MVHELIGIHDNKVDLSGTGKLPKDQQVELLFFPCCKFIKFQKVA
jgi:hypothetical protein